MTLFGAASTEKWSKSAFSHFLTLLLRTYEVLTWFWIRRVKKVVILDPPPEGPEWPLLDPFLDPFLAPTYEVLTCFWTPRGSKKWPFLDPLEKLEKVLLCQGIPRVTRVTRGVKKGSKKWSKSGQKVVILTTFCHFLTTFRHFSDGPPLRRVGILDRKIQDFPVRNPSSFKEVLDGPGGQKVVKTVIFTVFNTFWALLHESLQKPHRSGTKKCHFGTFI